MKQKLQPQTTRYFIEIQWKQFFIVSLLFAIFIGLWFLARPFQSDMAKYTPPLDGLNTQIEIKVLPDGVLEIDGKKSKERFLPDGEWAVLRYPIIDAIGTYYSDFSIRLLLPRPVAFGSECEFLGIHGVGYSSCQIVDDQTILYDAFDVSETASLSVITKLPRDSIKFPFLAAVYSKLNTGKSLAWALTAVILPTITFIYMLFFITWQRRKQNIDKSDQISIAPPMALPPALVGVLLHQRVGSREIAATLIDLASRGGIYIMDREHDFAFTKNRTPRQILPYEQLLLSKIFRDEGAVSNRQIIESRIGNHLYSKKISLVASELYSLATKLGYFIINPQRAHGKYRLIGLGGLCLGIVGLALSLKFFSNPPFIAFFWVGMMVSSIVVWVTARNIPIRSVVGKTALSNWISFRKYLASPEKMPFSYDSQEVFQKYLPYAIVLDCEAAWAQRFSDQNFTVPDWFVSESSSLSLQDFCLSLFPIVAFISKSFEAIIEPGYE
ncbi:MAG TPA: DUF2207 domain-containing protein [bacterium]|nr:DUF2207 domain-containing protein [bacterium]